MASLGPKYTGNDAHRMFVDFLAHELQKLGLGLLALATYFSRLPKAAPQRTLVFAFAAGHFAHPYVPSMNGFIERYPEMVRKAVASRCGRPRVPRLIHADLAAAWQREVCQQAPPFILHRVAINHVRLHAGDECLDVVAHEVELVHVVLL
jgi:hypothetical protein